MFTMFCRNFVTILLLISLNITGPVFVSSKELSCTCSELVAMMKPRVKVVRGRNWKYGDRHGTTPTTQGTVIGVDGSHFVWVSWDTERKADMDATRKEARRYRMGYHSACDLNIVVHITARTDCGTPSTTPVSTSTSTTPVSTSTSTTPVSTSTTVTPPPPESNNSTPPSPTSHQCTCSKEMSESQAKTDAEAAELCKEASKLAVEAGELSVETARVALEAATSRAKVEEAEMLIELETKKAVLEAAKSVAKAEESWAANEFEQLQFERARRNQSLETL